SDGDVRRAAVSLDARQPSERDAHGTVFYAWVQPEYFATMGIPLVRGRTFSGSLAQARAAVVSESAMRRLWPGRDAVGRSIRLAARDRSRDIDALVPDGAWQVVGVARDARGAMLDGSDSRVVYLPLPDAQGARFPLLVRTSGDARRIARRLVDAVERVDPAITATATPLRVLLRRSDAFLLPAI